jgi:hypothetical protein
MMDSKIITTLRHKVRYLSNRDLELGYTWVVNQN